MECHFQPQCHKSNLGQKQGLLRCSKSLLMQRWLRFLCQINGMFFHYLCIQNMCKTMILRSNSKKVWNSILLWSKIGLLIASEDWKCQFKSLLDLSIHCKTGSTWTSCFVSIDLTLGRSPCWRYPSHCNCFFKALQSHCLFCCCNCLRMNSKGIHYWK